LSVVRQKASAWSANCPALPSTRPATSAPLLTVVYDELASAEIVSLGRLIGTRLLIVLTTPPMAWLP
jgi:hypothetical protein